MASDAIRQEISISKQLSGHPYIVEFIAAAAIDKTQSKEDRNEFLLLNELCTGESQESWVLPRVDPGVFRESRLPFSEKRHLDLPFRIP